MIDPADLAPEWRTPVEAFLASADGARLAAFLEYRCDDLASKVACVRAELNHHRHRGDGEVP